MANIKKLVIKSFRLVVATFLGGLLAFNFSAQGGSRFAGQLPKAYAAASYSVGFNVDKAQATQGEKVTYSLTITNNGDVALTNFNVYQISRPQNTSYVNGSGVVTDSAGSTNVPDAWFSDPVGTNLGGLTVGQAMTFKWAVSVDDNATTGATINETIAVKSLELSDPNIYPINFLVSVGASRSSFCSSKSVDKSSANFGDLLTFTVRVCNDGDIDQTNVLVFDRLPKELTYQTGSTILNARGANITVDDQWVGNPNDDGHGINLGTIKSGESFTVTYKATLNGNALNGQKIENTAQTKSDQLPDWKQCAVTTTAIDPSLQKGHIIVKKIVDPSSDSTKFTFSGDLAGQIGHNGTLTKDVDPGQYSTTETVASGFELTSISCNDSDSTTDLAGRKAVFKVGASETVTCTFTNRLLSQAATSPNCALTKKIRLTNGEERTSVDGGTHVFASGEEVTYRIFVSNPGTGDAGSFNISDTLPTYIYWLRGDGGYDSVNNKVSFGLGTLKIGESRTLTYVAKVRDQIPAGQVTQTNNASASYNGGSCNASAPVVIGKPGQILAAAVLPQTGPLAPVSVVATLGSVVSGFLLRLRKIKKYKYWN